MRQNELPSLVMCLLCHLAYSMAPRAHTTRI